MDVDEEDKKVDKLIGGSIVKPKKKKYKKIDDDKVDELVGGSIENVVGESIDASAKFEEVEKGKRELTWLEQYHQNLKAVALEEAQKIRLQRVEDPLNDTEYRNEVAHYQGGLFYDSYPEDHLIKAKGLYSGKGSSNDHPHLRQLFLDSMNNYPELVDLYERS